MPAGSKKRRRQRLQRELHSTEAMTADQARAVRNIWTLSVEDVLEALPPLDHTVQETAQADSART